MENVNAGPGATVRQDFGGKEIQTQAETASVAVAAQARASVEARYKMALHRPRDFDEVRSRLLRECKRPGFAAKAIYHKPIGKGVEGPSIRFAEAAIRLMGNILVEAPTVYDDREKRIVRVIATDLETNATYQSDVVLEKTVERNDANGRIVIAERMNSRGKKAYLVLATEDELLNKVNALLSKAVRTNGLRLVPADLVEEGQAACRATMKDQDAKDPDAAKKRIADAFGELNVSPADLKEYLGHELGTVSPKELEMLRALYAAISDGETTWQAAMEHKRNKAAGESSAPSAPPPSQTTAPPPPKAEQQQAAPAPAQNAAPSEAKPEVKQTAPAPEVTPEPKKEEPPKEPAPVGGPEDQLEAVFAEARTKGELTSRAFALIKRLPEERQKKWRQLFNERLGELPKA